MSYALKNKVQLIGYMGNAPEIKEIEGGKKLARFSIATNETYRNATGEKVTETTWHSLVAWRNELTFFLLRFLLSQGRYPDSRLIVLYSLKRMT